MDPTPISARDAAGAPLDDLFSKLSCGPGGLTGAEAAERMTRFGANEIAEKKVNPLLKFLSYFWGPIPWMIEGAAILSLLVHHIEDFWIITALLLLNAVVGSWQEHKAGNAIEMLRRRLALMARVLRDGAWTQVAARELVPGDVVRTRLGDIVAADLKLMDGAYLLTDESALTGESLPVEKHPGDAAYSGSIARQGEMTGLVVATGMNTFFGRTAQLVSEAHTQSHFQRAVMKIGNYLIGIALAIVSVIFVVAMFRHESMLDALQFALILTVAAIPAALPAVLSVTMAVGAMALAKKEAIVSKLVAIEEMAGMDVLCSDKTGTITENRLTLAAVEPMEGFSRDDALLAAALASRAENADPIDDAVLGALKGSAGGAGALSACRQTSFTPFDPVSKRTEAEVETGGAHVRVSKGAPQAVVSLLGEGAGEVPGRVDAVVAGFAERGFRALGVARAEGDGPWRFVGLLGLEDPPRPDSAETIAEAQKMGVEVKMITGDHVAIAREIAKQVNLGERTVTGETFLKVPVAEAAKAAEDADVFAQVFPEHKYRIVSLLQSRDHIVGMTGDGVNDAPALKQADVGIAVAGATDAAKSAADIVLTQPGLSVILDAIRESRRIFQRMTNYSIYRITETIRVLLFIALSILVFNFYPVTAAMIVLLALFNDAPIMAIAYDNVRFSGRPEKWNMRVVLGVATCLGLTGVMFSFVLLAIGRDVLRLDAGVIQSLIFLKLCVSGHFTIFVARTRGPFWSIMPGKGLLWSAVATKVIATFVAVYGWYVTPLGWGLAGLVWGFSLVCFVATDFVKRGVYGVLDRGGRR